VDPVVVVGVAVSVLVVVEPEWVVVEIVVVSVSVAVFVVVDPVCVVMLMVVVTVVVPVVVDPVCVVVDDETVVVEPGVVVSVVSVVVLTIERGIPDTTFRMEYLNKGTPVLKAQKPVSTLKTKAVQSGTSSHKLQQWFADMAVELSSGSNAAPADGFAGSKPLAWGLSGKSFLL